MLSLPNCSINIGGIIRALSIRMRFLDFLFPGFEDLLGGGRSFDAEVVVEVDEAPGGDVGIGVCVIWCHDWI